MARKLDLARAWQFSMQALYALLQRAVAMETPDPTRAPHPPPHPSQATLHENHGLAADVICGHVAEREPRMDVTAEHGQEVELPEPAAGRRRPVRRARKHVDQVHGHCRWRTLCITPKGPRSSHSTDPTTATKATVVDA